MSSTVFCMPLSNFSFLCSSPLMIQDTHIFQRRVKLFYCLLHGFLPRREPLIRSRFLKFAQRQPPLDEIPVKTESQSLNVETIECNGTIIASKSESIRCGPKQYPTLRSDKLPKFSLPAAIHLVSKFRPTWYIGFCPNGRAFANLKPYKATCPNYHLAMGWNILYICPPVSSECRIPECRPTVRKPFTQLSGCPLACRLSIQCGNPPHVFPSVEH